MELFVHREGVEEPEIVEVHETALVRDLVVNQGPDGRVWVEEVEEEVSLDITLVEAGIRHHHHVHGGRCTRAEVSVRFNGKTFTKTYGPGTTVKTVARWACGNREAGLSAEQAAVHALAVPGADHALASGVHVGSLVAAGTCTVVLDLIPRDRFAG